ncbi:MAG: VOC family protein [Halioglobus sp.]
MNLNQVTVQSTDISESIKFYTDLGLVLIVEDKHYARFECPMGDSTFSVDIADQNQVSNTVVYFEVVNLKETVANLKVKGLEFIK